MLSFTIGALCRSPTHPLHFPCSPINGCRYVLSNIETKRGVRRGERIWQIAFGSGEPAACPAPFREPSTQPRCSAFLLSTSACRPTSVCTCSSPCCSPSAHPTLARRLQVQLCRVARAAQRQRPARGVVGGWQERQRQPQGVGQLPRWHLMGRPGRCASRCFSFPQPWPLPPPLWPFNSLATPGDAHLDCTLTASAILLHPAMPLPA